MIPPTSQPLPRLVLVHGNDLPPDFYAPLVSALSRRGLRTTTPTLPGFSGTPPLETPSWDALTTALATHIDDAHAPTVLVGHSMGGLLALLLAARQPPGLCGLVLLEPAIFPNHLSATVAGWRYLRRVVRADHDGFDNFNGGLKRVHDVDGYPVSAIDAHLAARRDAHRPTAEALFGRLATVHPPPFAAVAVPALVISAAHAGFVGRWMSTSAAKQLSASHVQVPNAAHWVVNEADDAVADAVLAFVAGLRA